MRTIEFIEGTHPNNYQKGRVSTQDGKQYTVNQIVIHSIVGSLDSAIRTFQKPDRIASAHYIVGYDGRIVQLVQEQDTAYHAGNYEINLQSIGIEHDDQAKPYEPRPDELYESSAQLVAHICKKYNLPINRSVIKQHKEVSKSPTACPASLDIMRIVNRAIEIRDGETKNNNYTITPFTRNVTVTTPDGLNVRNTPSLEGSIMRVLPVNTPIAIEGIINGGTVNGNSYWYKLKDGQLFVWAGATNIPIPTVTSPQQEPVKETPIETPKPPVDSLSTAEIQEQLRIVREQNSRLVRLNEDFKLELEKSKEEQKTTLLKNEKLEQELINYTTMRNSNKILSEQVEAYKNKVSDLKLTIANSYEQAFSGWELIEIPKGTFSFARLPLVATQIVGLVTSVFKHNYVIGWKKDARLYSKEEFKEVLDPNKKI